MTVVSPACTERVRRTGFSVTPARSDPPAVLEALCDTLQTLAPYDGAVPWLRTAVLSVAEDKPLPPDTMVPLLRALRRLNPQPRPKELVPYTADAGRGLSLTAPDATLPEVLERIADRSDDRGPDLLTRFLLAFSQDTASRHHANLEPVRALLAQVFECLRAVEGGARRLRGQQGAAQQRQEQANAS